MKAENIVFNLVVFLMTLLLGLAGISSGKAQSRIPAPINPVSFTPAADFNVQIDGKNAMVYASPIPANFCSFVMTRPVEVTIKSLTRDIKWVDVRPLSAGMTPVFQNGDSTIRFTIRRTGQYSIELNGGIKIPLYLFANSLEINKPDKTDKNVLYFESGKIHYPGTINMKDNQQVYIEAGAIVVGNIKARNANHIKIRGQGILDGSYSRQFMDSLAIVNLPVGFAPEQGRRGGTNGLLLFNECNDVTIEGITLYNSKTWDVVPTICNNVKIDNIKIVSDNGGDDGIDIVSTKNITITNSFIHTKDDCIAVKSHARPQPPVSQTSPTQSNSAQQRPQQTFGQLSQGPFYDVDSALIKNCVFWNAAWGNALEIGFELSGDVKNVRFIDNDIIHVEGGAAFSIHNARRGVVSNILVDNLRVEGTDQKLFDLAIFRSIYSEDGLRDQVEINKLYVHGIWDNVLAVPEADKESRMKFRGQIKNITLKNVCVVDGPFPFSVFYGSDKEHVVENVFIENLKIHGKKINKISEAKFYLENAKGIVIK
ncbi:MAG: glycosyl hydrolase family 28 protein [Chitinophagaceae bacterium]